MEMDILRSNMIVKKSYNNIMTFYEKVKSQSNNILYFTKYKKNSIQHIILYQKDNEKQFRSNLKMLENTKDNISIFTDNDKMKYDSSNNISFYNCDVRTRFRLIFSMGTVMNLKKRNSIDVEDVLYDIMATINNITLKKKEFINLLDRVLQENYPLGKNKIKYILHFYQKYKSKYNDDYVQSFKDIVFTILNENTCTDYVRLEELMMTFTEISLKYFEIVLDWVYLYYLENSNENVLIYYVEEAQFINLKKYMKHNGYMIKKEENNESFKSSCAIQ